MKETKLILLGVLVLWGFTGSLSAVDFTNYNGMEFNVIPAGSFFMGSCKPDAGQPVTKTSLFGLVNESTCPSGGTVDPAAEQDEMPQHKVDISKAFQMGVYEVTVKQFRAFLKDAQKSASVSFNKYNSEKEQSAVVWVSWYQVQEFINWLNAKKPVDDSGIYRLPTEAEWEYAARAGSSAAYFFGDDSLQISRFGWTIKDAQEYGRVWSLPVGGKQPNPWGLYDIYGNVWEWVSDSYQETYYQHSPAVDPKGPDSGTTQVIRGCSLYTSAKNCRSAKRHFMAPDQRDGTVGLRLVRELP